MIVSKLNINPNIKNNFISPPPRDSALILLPKKGIAERKIVDAVNKAIALLLILKFLILHHFTILMVF